MGMVESTLFYTADMVRELIDEERPSPRYETVYGELLVTPVPSVWHQAIAGRLYVALTGYLARESGVGGLAMIAPADISWGRPDVLVQPDVFVIARPPSLRFPWADVTRLLLAAEVVSPSSRSADYFRKRRLYQDRGTALYWVLDPDRGSAELWTPSSDLPRTEAEALRWQPEGAERELVLPLAELFLDH